MNWAWFDGKMPLHLYQEEHGLDPHPVIEELQDAESEAVTEEPEPTEAKHGD